MLVKEGELYKRITVHGQQFEIRYGYYEEKDKYGKYNEPVPIYPSFHKQPIFTDDGFPFVTHMQDTCIEYKGADADAGCYWCAWFEKGDDLIGVCKNPKKQLRRK
jgi:hypothetical protein